MACINPDGSITRPARAMLSAMRQPATLEQVSRDSGVPLYRVRSVIRELLDAKLAAADGEMHSVTGLGLEKLNS